MLYMSSEWDFYYCYRCRGWFKKPFKDGRVSLPVTDRSEVRRLTWIYSSRMEVLHRNHVLLDRLGVVWHGLGRRATQV